LRRAFDPDRKQRNLDHPFAESLPYSSLFTDANSAFCAESHSDSNPYSCTDEERQARNRL